jgi:hypothetical protein
MYRSEDGISWEGVNASVVVPRAAVAGVVVGVSGNTLYRSFDLGFSWEEGVSSSGGLGFLDGAVEGP